MRFGLLMLLATLAPAGVAVAQSAGVTGLVRDAGGVPQMGALVQIVTPDARVWASVFTDMKGRYMVGRLTPGLYGIRATTALSLPASRENLYLQKDRRAVVNLTLSGIFAESAWLPARPRGADEQTDDWNWTLRSSANRPILKFDESEDAVLTAFGGERGHVRAGVPVRATLTSPSKAFGQGSTRVRLRAGRVQADGSGSGVSTTLGFARNVPGAGRGVGVAGAEMPVEVSAFAERSLGPAGMVASRVTYTGHPEIANGLGGAGLAGVGLGAVSVSSAERFGLGDFAEIEAGDETQAIRGPQLARAAESNGRADLSRRSGPIGGSGSIVVHHPFFRVSTHPDPAWMVSYSLATSPGVQDYDSAIHGDVAMPVAAGFNGRFDAEKGVHQEIAVAHRTKGTLLAIAYYADAIDRIRVSGREDSGAGWARQGGGEAGEDEVLVDQSSGSIQALSQGYEGGGLNVLFTRMLGPQTEVTVQFCTGMALTAPDVLNREMSIAHLAARRSEAATLSVKTTVVRTGTRVRATYRWQADHLLTSIDPYDVLPGGDYLSLRVRQPLFLQGLLPDGMELTVDGSNVLGQGYRHVQGAGRPLYLASSPSSLRAGLAFTF